MRSLRMQKLAGIRKVAGTVTLDSQGGNNWGMSLTNQKGFYSATDDSILYCDENKNWSLAAKSDGTITSRSVPFPALEQGASYAVKTAGPSEKAQEKFVELRSKAKEEMTPGVSSAGYIIKNDLKISVSIIQDEIKPIPPAKELIPGASDSFNPSSRMTVSYKDSAGKDLNTTIGSIKLKDAVKDQKGPTYSVNLSELSNALAPLKSSGSEGGSRRRSSGGGGGQPQATSGEILIDPEHRGLTGLVDANDPKFVYTTAPDGSWADYTHDGKPGSRRLDKTFKNWPKVVSQMNSFPIGDATKTAPAATTTAPTTPSGAEAAKAPVPEGEAAGLQTRRVVSDATVMNVAKVLTDVYGGATYAGRTVFRNEMGMVRKMMDQLNTTAQSLGVTIGSAEALAQIITPSIRPGLGRFGTANLDGLGERDMEKQYRAELNLIMTAVKNLFDRIKKSPAQLLNYQPNLRDAAIALKQKREGAKTPAAGTTPAATPAPSAPATPAPSAAATPTTGAGGTPEPKAEANDGSSFGKKSSLNPKFKKLAKLRRLRVRGQMEAAIEPSARLGVSRVS